MVTTDAARGEVRYGSARRLPGMRTDANSMIPIDARDGTLPYDDEHHSSYSGTDRSGASLMASLCPFERVQQQTIADVNGGTGWQTSSPCEIIRFATPQCGPSPMMPSIFSDTFINSKRSKQLVSYIWNTSRRSLLKSCNHTGVDIMNSASIIER